MWGNPLQNDFAVYVSKCRVGGPPFTLAGFPLHTCKWTWVNPFIDAPARRSPTGDSTAQHLCCGTAAHIPLKMSVSTLSCRSTRSFYPKLQMPSAIYKESCVASGIFILWPCHFWGDVSHPPAPALSTKPPNLLVSHSGGVPIAPLRRVAMKSALGAALLLSVCIWGVQTELDGCGVLESIFHWVTGIQCRHIPSGW